MSRKKTIMALPLLLRECNAALDEIRSDERARGNTFREQKPKLKQTVRSPAGC